MSAETFLNGRVTLHCGDCLNVLESLPENSVDSVTTDPPYHLTSIVKRFGAGNAAPAKVGATGAFSRASRGFMGKQWDGGDIAFRPDTWAAVYRVLKPGGYLVAFSGTRTYHRMACAIEDAGFDIRDSIFDLVASDNAVSRFMASLNDEQACAFMKCIAETSFTGLLAWVYGSGFPKSHNISKAIDKMLGAVRRVVGSRKAHDIRGGNLMEASQNVGQGLMQYSYTAAGSPEAAEWEGWGTAIKPAIEPICLARKPVVGTVAENVMRYGTGALNINGCGVGKREKPKVTDPKRTSNTYGEINSPGGKLLPDERWPANVIHDGSAEVLEAFPEAPGQLAAVGPQHGNRDAVNVYGDYGQRPHAAPRGDKGSAARFFYTAKADIDDRLGSKHPTIKPLDLMQWLVRLVTPPGGTVLDCFAGTGTTGEAAWREGFNAILIEREPEYQADIRRRMSLVLGGPDERHFAAIKAAGKTKDAGELFAWGNKNARNS